VVVVVDRSTFAWVIVELKDDENKEDDIFYCLKMRKKI